MVQRPVRSAKARADAFGSFLMAVSSSSPRDLAEAGQNGASAHPGLPALVLGSLGVVFGDIGTSPLYAIRVATAAAVPEDGIPDRATMLGILSLMLWALILIVSIK